MEKSVVITLVFFSLLFTGCLTNTNSVRSSKDTTEELPEVVHSIEKNQESRISYANPELLPEHFTVESGSSAIIDMDIEEAGYRSNSKFVAENNQIDEHRIAVEESKSQGNKSEVNEQSTSGKLEQSEKGLNNPVKTVEQERFFNNNKENHDKKKNVADKKLESEVDFTDYTVTEDTDLAESDVPESIGDLIEEGRIPVKAHDFTIFENDPESRKITEKSQFTITIPGANWILQKNFPKLLKVTKRISDADYTSFRFDTLGSGYTEATFIKYDMENERIKRKIYKIDIVPEEIIMTKEDISPLDEVVTEKKTDTKQTDDKETPEKTAETKSDNETGNIVKETSSESEDYRKDIADKLYRQRRYAQARKWFEELIAEEPEDSELNYKMGVIYKMLSDSKNAERHFRNNIEIGENPFYEDSLVEYINILKDNKKYRDAIETIFRYSEDIEFKGSTAENIHMLLADIYYLMSEYDESSKEYKRFYTLYPESSLAAKALFYLAYSLEKKQINPEYKRAYSLYKELMKKYPESEYYGYGNKRKLHLERHYLKIN